MTEKLHEIETRQGRLYLTFISPHQFPLIITMLFVAVAGLGFYIHEMWRDEFEIFLELRDTPDFLAMFPDIQPLPNLYLALLYPVIKLWPYPAAFQIFHFIVISLAVFIFNKYSPFNLLQKFFFTFSYFALFEYGIISRDYSMLLLLLFSSVVLITREKKNPVMIAVSLLLLANHHIYGAFFSISLFLFIGFQMAGRIKEFSPPGKKSLLMAGGLLAIGCLYLVPQYLLLAKFNRFSDMFQSAPLFLTLRSIWNAFFPVPGTTGIHFWNTNIFPFPFAALKNAPAAQFISTSNMTSAALSIFILLASTVIFSRNRPVMFVFLMNTAMQIFFLQYLSVFFVRYQGPLFIIFIYCCWLLFSFDKHPNFLVARKASPASNSLFFSSVKRLTSSVVTLLLAVQFCIGIFCYIQHARYPFTASLKAAEYIRDNKLTDTVIVGYVDYIAQSISGHLGVKIYYPQSGKFGSHVIWRDPNRRSELDLSMTEVVGSGIGLYRQQGRKVLLVLSHPPLEKGMHPLEEGVQPLKYLEIDNYIKLRYLNEFTESIVPDENYYLYLITHDP